MTEFCCTVGTRLCSAAELDLVKTFECGQCFRWKADGTGAYTGIACGRAATLWTEDETVYIDAPEVDMDFWSAYFDLSTDYCEARRSLQTGAYLSRCAEYGDGIRILRQEPWEALCSFILSQCNNIPRIKGITERLCAMFGEAIAYRGGICYAFPTAEQIAGLTEEDLAPLRSGYRAPYIIAAAKAVASGALDLKAIAELPCEAARAQLKKLPGVGDKVANCVMLFGMHRMDTFPVDVWIKRILLENFEGDFRPDSLGPFAGLAQQYMFYYARSNDESVK